MTPMETSHCTYFLFRQRMLFAHKHGHIVVSQDVSNVSRRIITGLK